MAGFAAFEACFPLGYAVTGALVTGAVFVGRAFVVVTGLSDFSDATSFLAGFVWVLSGFFSAYASMLGATAASVCLERFEGM